MNNCDWEETKGLAIERVKGLMADGLPWRYIPSSPLTLETFSRNNFRVRKVDGDVIALTYHFNEIDRSPWTLQVWDELSVRRTKAEHQAKCERVLALLFPPPPTPEPPRPWWMFWR